MKIKTKSHKYRKRRAQLEKLMEDPIKFQNKIGTEIRENDVQIIHEICRDARLDELIESMDIDKKEYEKTRNEIITLNPDDEDYPLHSKLFKNLKGKYEFEKLLFKYHDSVLRGGMIIGMDYGKKFLIEDIQNNRFTKKDIINMTKKQVDEYCDEVREQI